jgi:hypothetical protein
MYIKHQKHDYFELDIYFIHWGKLKSPFAELVRGRRKVTGRFCSLNCVRRRLFPLRCRSFAKFGLLDCNVVEDRRVPEVAKRQSERNP